MISPQSDSLIPTLVPTHLTAILLYMDRNGTLQPDHNGFIGEVVDGDARVVAPGLWAVKTMLGRGLDVVQRYVHGAFDRTRIHNPHSFTLDATTLVVTRFEAGLLGAVRAQGHAHQRVRTQVQELHVLMSMSDEALEFALVTNLHDAGDLEAHLQHIAELQDLVHSESPLAQEMMRFLESLESPEDVTNRHNVYRMVLMVRAVQRRAQALAEHKADVLRDIMSRHEVVGKLVNTLIHRCSRMATELADEQPWWLGEGDHKPANRRKLVSNFAAHLRRYAVELMRIPVRPFHGWTQVAIKNMQAVANLVTELNDPDVSTNDDMRAKKTVTLRRNTARAIAALQAVVVREQISLAISMDRSGDTTAYLRLLTSLETWVRIADNTLPATSTSAMTTLKNALTAMQVVHASSSGEREAYLQLAEHVFDALGDAVLD